MTKQNKQLAQTDETKNFNPSISIIDDDPIASAVMKARLLKQFPDSNITTTKDPVVEPNCDIYLVDNDFDGMSLANVLLRQIRELNPYALVVAMSNTLDQAVLESLMNGGCNAVYNKSRPAQIEQVFEVIENYIKIVRKQRQSKNGKPLSSILDSLKGLMEQWNQRLSKDIS